MNRNAQTTVHRQQAYHVSSNQRQKSRAGDSVNASSKPKRRSGRRGTGTETALDGCCVSNRSLAAVSLLCLLIWSTPADKALVLDGISYAKRLFRRSNSTVEDLSDTNTGTLLLPSFPQTAKVRMTTIQNTSISGLPEQKSAATVEDPLPPTTSSSSNQSLTLPEPFDFRDGRPRNLRIAFVGDETTRAQYLSLVYFIKTGSWYQTPRSTGHNLRGSNSRYSVTTSGPNKMFNFLEYVDFYDTMGSQWTSQQATVNKRSQWISQQKIVNDFLAPFENCNCYIEVPHPSFNSTDTPEQTLDATKNFGIVEHRYFADPINKIFVSFHYKLGNADVVGHWGTPTGKAFTSKESPVYEYPHHLHHYDVDPFGQTHHKLSFGNAHFIHMAAVWEGNWSSIVTNHLSQFPESERPSFYVYNPISSGISSQVYTPATLDLISDVSRTALQHSIQPIYKTTVPWPKPLTSTRTNASENASLTDRSVCAFLDKATYPPCLNYNWTSDLPDSTGVSDPPQYDSSVYTQMNQQLLEYLSRLPPTKH
jgi:hypothetical protein